MVSGFNMLPIYITESPDMVTENAMAFSLSSDISKMLDEMSVNKKLLYCNLHIAIPDFTLDYTLLMNRQNEDMSLYYFVSVQHVDVFITKIPTGMWELAIAFTD